MLFTSKGREVALIKIILLYEYNSISSEHNTLVINSNQENY